jgi:hypothetical protein
MRIKQLLSMSFFILVLLLTNGCISQAVYRRLVIKPDKISHEFKYKAIEGLYPNKKIIEGTYLGKESISGKEYYHLQFSHVLKGDERCLHLYLICQNSDVTSKEYLKGFMVEEEKIEDSSAKKSLLFYYYYPYDTKDKKTVLSEVAKKIFSENGMEEYPTYIFGWVWDSQGTFICYPPYGWENINSWNCTVDISRVERSKVMPFIRPIYGVPATIICIPADIIMTLYTAGEALFISRRPETILYWNIAEYISGRNEDDN